MMTEGGLTIMTEDLDRDAPPTLTDASALYSESLASESIRVADEKAAGTMRVANGPSPSMRKNGFDHRKMMVRNMWLYEEAFQREKQMESSSKTPSADRKYTAEACNYFWWKPDSSSSHCAICNDSFGWFSWRHHCRRCGELVCARCSPYVGPGRMLREAPPKVLEQIRKNVPQRMCYRCYVASKAIEETLNRASVKP